MVIVLILLAVGVFIYLKIAVFGTSPSAVVEEYLNKYNSLDKGVTSKIKYEFEDKLDKKQKKQYESIMKKQYQKMFYSILDEEVVENKAVVDSHIATHTEKFPTVERQINYKLNKLETCSEKVTYPITFNLRKSSNEWLLDNLLEADSKKISGTY